MKKIVYMSLLVFSLGGCGYGILGAGAGVNKMGSARQVEAETENKKAYTDYVVQMERVNLEREKAGFKPNKILSMEEWDSLDQSEDSPSNDDGDGSNPDYVD